MGWVTVIIGIVLLMFGGPIGFIIGGFILFFALSEGVG